MGALFTYFCFLVGILISMPCVTSQSRTFDWVKQLGSDTWDDPISITTDINNNVYSIGNFTDTLDLDPGSATYLVFPKGRQDSYISKLDELGNFVWAKQVGGHVVDCADVAVDSKGNVLITGSFLGQVDFDPGPGLYNLLSSSSTDAFICKLDAAGNFLWAIKYSPSTFSGIFPYPVYSNSIEVDEAGNVYTTGSFDGKTDFDPGPGVYFLEPIGRGGAYTTDIFISKLNAGGQFVWAKSMGGKGFEGGEVLSLDGKGHIYSTGWFNDTVDFDPGPAEFRLGTSGLNDLDFYVSKLDAAGNFIWVKQFGIGETYLKALALATDSQGDVYVGGSGYQNINGIAVYKLASNGNILWSKKTMANWCTSMAVDTDNYVYFSGLFSGTKDFDPGAGEFNMTSSQLGSSFISKLDSGGNFIWAWPLGGPGLCQTRINSVAVDLNYNIYTTGWFSLIANFDPDSTNFSLVAAGSFDGFILKMKQKNSSPGEPTPPGRPRIYPNPTSSKIRIEFNGFRCTRIIIRNSLGQFIQALNVSNQTAIDHEITGAGGSYILELFDANGQRLVQKILKIPSN